MLSMSKLIKLNAGEENQEINKLKMFVFISKTYWNN